MMNPTGIYLITHRASGKRYVGKSINIPRRWSEHRKGLSHCPVLEAALKKYGADAFDWEILQTCSESELNDLECWYIQAFGSVSPGGYNIGYGGEGVTFTEEVRAKLSEATRKRLLSAESRAAIGEASRKRYEDPRERERHSDILRRSPALKKALERIHNDPSWRKAVTESVRRVCADPRRYVLENVITGEREEGQRVQFKDRFGISASMFSDLLKGRLKTAKGWKLVNNEG